MRYRHFPYFISKRNRNQKLFRIFDNAVAEIIIYNPDKWKFVKYSFIENLPKSLNPNIKFMMYYISHNESTDLKLLLSTLENRLK